LTEISVSWQHCLTPYAAKSKIGTAESKLNPQKHFAPRHGTAHLRRARPNEKPEIHTYRYFIFCI
jgi:hypothetical protein